MFVFRVSSRYGEQWCGQLLGMLTQQLRQLLKASLGYRVSSRPGCSVMSSDIRDKREGPNIAPCSMFA